MSYIHNNPNPVKNLVGDCVIRGISLLTNKTWEEVYWDVVMQGARMYDMPSSNEVWGTYLKSLGYKKRIIPNMCPECYSIKEFCIDKPLGRYLLATGTHVVTVINGDYLDTWDSGDEIPVYYFTKEEY